ncbi:hypothetical protein NX794_05650 [Streptomyces sp. LP11]|uniref:Band 7 domain-containing protein n=1 Tax=Streptomyces pyxinicus TaxID=2970331 RepID=A0ABT2AWT3_9ACTN|nr:hypothetical protein [Streptomyces sp. LP11]MCS0600716.1 hypothetical protein [Streptomyces sp. LP11]
MEEQTYDPVLGSEDVPKWRLVNPLRPPAPGRALVLVRDSGPSLTIRSGEEIPSSRFGSYRRVFTVDMTEHRLVLDIPLLSRDPTFSFRSRVDLVCRVADPAEVVARGIRDMSGALYGYLRRTLQSVARNHDIAEFHDTEIALNAALVGFGGDDAIRLRNIQVELLVDEEEIATSGREYRDVVRETRLEGMRRRRHLDMVREEGVDGLIAAIMEKEGPRAALAWIEKGEAEKREVRREVMRMVLERGDADREPFEQAELERAVLDEVLRDGDGLFETATRRGRLRGSLARALEPGTEGDDHTVDEDSGGPAPLKGEVLREPYADDTGRGPGAGDPGAGDGGRDRDAGRAPRSRLSGTGGRRSGPAATAGPPADEPLPGVGGGRDGTGRLTKRDEYDSGSRSGERAGAGGLADGGTATFTGAGYDAADRAADDRAASRDGGLTGPGGGGSGGPRVSRVRGTAKRRLGASGSDEERR